MAAVRIEKSYESGEDIAEFIGTAAEQEDVDTSGVGAGSTYWATDTKTGYILDGTKTWCALS